MPCRKQSARLFLFNFPFSVFCRGNAEMVLEISVKGAERGISHLEGALQYGFIGIVEKVARLIEPENIKIGDVGDARGLLEATRKMGIIVAYLRRQPFKRAFAGKILLNEGKNLGKQAFLPHSDGSISSRFVKG